VTDFSLPQLVAQAAPEFMDSASAKAWLEHVPLANVGAAQHQMLLQLEDYNRYATSASARLETLETLRDAVNFVQIEQAKRFTHRALPIAPAEAQVFQDTIELWDEMRQGYLRCLEAAEKNDAGMRERAGLLAQRALAYSGLKMFHHHRAYRQIPGKEWRLLHRIYSAAERLGVAEQTVKDYLNRDVHETSARIAYVRALLIGIANPNELSQRQLTFVAFLLERWAEKTRISRTPIAEEGVPPLVVDLAGDTRPERSGTPAKEPRYIDAQPLGKSLRNRIGLLRRGESPSKLALGEDCVQPSCEQLLVLLYRQWLQPPVARAQDRKRSDGTAHACQDMAAIYHHVSGHEFRQPGGKAALTKEEADQVATFGRIRESTQQFSAPPIAHLALEEWHVEDESALGIKIMRRAGNSGARYTHAQLIGLRPKGVTQFLLGHVRWLLQAENNDLFLGVRVLPGLPAGIGVRPSAGAGKDQFVPALSLTAVPEYQAPPTLILPSGWYRPNRLIDVFIESVTQVRLVEFLDRGSDFERLTYETVR
jgi:cyclic-di-GMP-binding protein